MNPYKIDGQTAISFSGGRTSAYMLHKVLEANGGLPEECKVVFANTGKEMPETLDFVHQCEVEWGVDIVWLELGEPQVVGEWKSGSKAAMPRFRASTDIVSYETASRNGEPFERLVNSRKYLPNAVSRFCTAELKVVRIRDYLKGCGEDNDWIQFIGIRADEPSRIAKIHNTINEGHEMWCPLVVDGVTKEDVHAFWKAQPFDLNLYSNNGTTDWGNCDLCFLKGPKKKLSLIRERPDLADWWAGMEAKMEGICGSAARFRADQPDYATMKVIATDQPGLFDFDDDETIPCFCGD